MKKRYYLPIFALLFLLLVFKSPRFDTVMFLNESNNPQNGVLVLRSYYLARNLGIKYDLYCDCYYVLVEMPSKFVAKGISFNLKNLTLNEANNYKKNSKSYQSAEIEKSIISYIEDNMYRLNGLSIEVLSYDTVSNRDVIFQFSVSKRNTIKFFSWAKRIENAFSIKEGKKLYETDSIYSY